MTFEKIRRLFRDLEHGLDNIGRFEDSYAIIVTFIERMKKESGGQEILNLIEDVAQPVVFENREHAAFVMTQYVWHNPETTIADLAKVYGISCGAVKNTLGFFVEFDEDRPISQYMPESVEYTIIKRRT